MNTEILSSAQSLGAEIQSWRRELHRFPETGLETPQTEAYICRHLDEWGVEYRRGVGGHGVVATIRGRTPGACFGIRCDCDGLPIREESGEPFASTNGAMHACGHDAHTAIGLGTARLLSCLRKHMAGCVKILFQPGEETGEGAKAMIADGCLANPDVDILAALHVSPHWNDDLMGDVMGFRAGGLMACMDRFDVGLSVQPGGDAAAACARIISGVQCVPGCLAPYGEPTVVSICNVKTSNEGGRIRHATLSGTARALSPKARAFVSNSLRKIVEGNAVSSGVLAGFRYTRGAPPLVNDAAATELMRCTAAELFGEDAVKTIRRPVMGGEDFAYYLERVPGTMFFFAATPADGTYISAHNSHYRIRDTQLWRGTALFASAALQWLAGRHTINAQLPRQESMDECSVYWTLSVHGRGGHGAYPQDCVDPVVLAAGAVERFYRLLSRRKDPVIHARVDIVDFDAPGAAFNVLPSDCTVRGILRANDEEWFTWCLQQMRQDAESLCKTAGASCTFAALNGKNDGQIQAPVFDTHS